MDIKRGLTGAAAVAGGALWIVFAALAVGLPEGCVGDECLLRSTATSASSSCCSWRAAC